MADHKHPSAEEFASQKFDVIIVGGGTAGLCLAARLTEDPAISVGVLEAGENRMSDPMITIPGLHSQTYEKPEYDWIFKTVPQVHVRNDIHGWPRGKVLGGSSAINYGMVAQPSRRDIDNWAALGNPGWSYDDLIPYYQKSETYTAPPDSFKAVFNESFDPELHGKFGPIQVSWPKKLNPVQEIWTETCKNMGLESFDTRIGGSVTAHMQPISMDSQTATRSYSASAYFAPNAGRPNLSVCTGAMVTRILLELKQAGSVTATGVEFTSGGVNYTVKAAREVLLSAGAVQSPQLLEVSGIGVPEILQPLGIHVAVENNGVGENLQDHILTGCCFEALDGTQTLDAFRDMDVVNAAIGEYMQTGTQMFLSNSITTTAQFSFPSVLVADEKETVPASVGRLIDEARVSPAVRKQHQLLREMLFSPEHAALTVVPHAAGANMRATESGAGLFSHTYPGAFISIASNMQHPFSRGSIHVKSKDINEHPIIDPKYLSHPADMEVLWRGLRNLRNVVKAEPLSAKLKQGGDVVMPGFESFAKGDYAECVKDGLGTQWHPIGTCSMLPREDGGVVNTKLRVYGVDGLRVVDASIIPLHIQGNIQTAVYAIAEKAADIIKADWAS